MVLWQVDAVLELVVHAEEVMLVAGLTTQVRAHADGLDRRRPEHPQHRVEVVDVLLDDADRPSQVQFTQSRIMYSMSDQPACRCRYQSAPWLRTRAPTGCRRWRRR